MNRISGDMKKAWDYYALGKKEYEKDAKEFIDNAKKEIPLKNGTTEIKYLESLFYQFNKDFKDDLLETINTGDTKLMNVRASVTSLFAKGHAEYAEVKTVLNELGWTDEAVKELFGDLAASKVSKDEFIRRCYITLKHFNDNLTYYGKALQLGNTGKKWQQFTSFIKLDEGKAEAYISENIRNGNFTTKAQEQMATNPKAQAVFSAVQEIRSQYGETNWPPIAYKILYIRIALAANAQGAPNVVARNDQSATIIHDKLAEYYNEVLLGEKKKEEVTKTTNPPVRQDASGNGIKNDAVVEKTRPQENISAQEKVWRTIPEQLRSKNIEYVYTKGDEYWKINEDGTTEFFQKKATNEEKKTITSDSEDSSWY